MIEILPLRPEHVAACGLESAPMTLEGVALIEGDRTLGLSAVYLTEGAQVVVAEFTAEALKNLKRPSYAKAMLTAARRVLAIAARRHIPIYSRADDRWERAGALLEHLGFVHQYERIYLWAPR